MCYVQNLSTPGFVHAPTLLIPTYAKFNGLWFSRNAKVIKKVSSRLYMATNFSFSLLKSRITYFLSHQRRPYSLLRPPNSGSSFIIFSRSRRFS